MVFHKSRYLHLVALFLIALVLSMPFYSAEVYAAISNIKAVGQDGIDNYVRETDYVVFSAGVYVNGDPVVTPDQVWLGQSYQFDGCSQASMGYQCSLQYPGGNGTTKFAARSTPFTINIKDDNGTVIETQTSTFYIDNNPPVVTYFEVQHSAGSRNVTVLFEINDSACLDSSCIGCSGIDKLHFYENQSGNKTMYSGDVKVSSSSCNYKSNLTLPASKFADGNHTLSLEVYDNVGLVSSIVDSAFYLDSTAPRIDSNSFGIIDPDGGLVGFASSTARQVTFGVNILDSDLDTSSVTGNFSSIGSQDSLKASCSLVGSYYLCKWVVSFTNQNSTSSYDFGVSASDTSGNSASAEISKSFALDDTGPSVVSIYTDYAYNNKTYAKLGPNMFYAQITESGSGLIPSQVMMDFGRGTSKPANNCTSGWVCEWNYSVSSGSFNSNINSATTDRAKNPASSYTQQIIVDSSAPVLKNISVNNTGGQYPSLSGYFKVGDSLIIEATLKDEAFLSAYVDLSQVIKDSINVSADSCTTSGQNLTVCTWSTSAMDVEAQGTERTLAFTFTDVVGNALTHNEKITVYGAINGTIDYWGNEVACSPTAIDREVTTFINQRNYCTVSLKAKNNDATPVKITLAGCNPGTALQSEQIFNNIDGSTELFLELILKKTSFTVNDLPLNCSLEIYSKVKDKITSYPESESVAVSLEFYNNALGEFSQGTLDQVKEAVKDAKGVWEIIGILNKIVFYCKMLCNLIRTLNTIISLFQTVTLSLEVASDVVIVAKPAMATAQGAMCESTEGLSKVSVKFSEYAKMFCDFVTCKQFYGTDTKYIGSVGKWQEYWMGSNKGTGGDGAIGSLGGNFISKWTGKDPLDYLNPEESLVISLMMACLPGIIYNLNKWRQIQCAYAYCLKTSAAQEGLPITACQSQKSYAQCKYIFGEIFNLIPFFAIFNYYSKLIKDILSNPFKLLGFALALPCVCIPGNEPPHAACRIVKIISLLGSAIQDVTSIIENGFEIKGDYCENLDDIEKWANEQKTTGSSNPTASNSANQTI